MRRFSSLTAAAALMFSTGFPALPVAQAQAYNAQPKLVVIVVIDQFRGDYLQRYRSELKGRGFRLFLNEGAWFPDCYYNYANTKTAPGHATIGTGAYSDGHGIEANEYWDATRSFEHKVSSVQDERYAMVDLPAGSKDTLGASPRSLRASTLGDEVKLATQGRSLVFGVSLKDRAAILPPGQTANAAYWMDNASGHFTTSTYYREHLPEWATAFNASGRTAEAVKEAGGDGTGPFNAQVEPTPAANHYELDFTEALIAGEKLGQHETTDVLTVSLSAHDIMGHKYGPDSDQERAMVLGLDRDLDRFFASLDKTVGLKNVWLALTADHGVAPKPAVAAGWGLNAASVDVTVLAAGVNEELNRRFSAGKAVNYLLFDEAKPRHGLELPYVTLDQREFKKAGIDERTAEEALSEALRGTVAQMAAAVQKPEGSRVWPPVPGVVGTYTRLQMERGELPATDLGRELGHSYSSHGNWWVMLVLNGYQMEDVSSWGATTHFSPWSYDRHVPLAFYGSPFAAGTYRGKVEPVDLAATFASLLGVNQPSAAVGRVLTEALKK